MKTPKTSKSQNERTKFGASTCRGRRRKNSAQSGQKVTINNIYRRMMGE